MARAASAPLKKLGAERRSARKPRREAPRDFRLPRRRAAEMRTLVQLWETEGRRGKRMELPRQSAQARTDAEMAREQGGERRKRPIATSWCACSTACLRWKAEFEFENGLSKCTVDATVVAPTTSAWWQLRQLVEFRAAPQ